MRGLSKKDFILDTPGRPCSIMQTRNGNALTSQPIRTFPVPLPQSLPPRWNDEFDPEFFGNVTGMALDCLEKKALFVSKNGGEFFRITSSLNFQ